MGQTPAGSALTLQEKINKLFATVRPPGQDREYTLPEAHKALAALGFQTSTSYLSSLRTGQRTNPSKAVLEGLAQFFGVSPLYFFDDEQAAVIEKELELLNAMRDGQIRAIALRASQLSDADRELLRRIAETMGEPLEPAPAESQNGGGPTPAAARRRPAVRASGSRPAGKKASTPDRKKT